MKKALALITALIILVSAGSITYSAPKESLHVKKIVSLVYDDSGSMLGDKWAYANYATQAFLGMLNREDRLFITYMSRAQKDKNYKPEEADLSSEGIQETVDTLRSHKDNLDTPFRAVEVAYNKLKSIPCNDENAQYWLVVITDGVFDETVNMTNDQRKAYLNSKFRGYANEKMPNNTHVNTTFLAIGGDVIPPDGNEEAGIFPYSAETADGIIDAMSLMAHKISGRARVKDSAISIKNGNTAEITTTLPLLNIAVVSQKTPAVIKKITGKTKTDVTREISVSYPGYEDLIGKSYLCEPERGIMEDGTYQIVFDKPITHKDLVILLEPAIEVKIFANINGEKAKNLNELKKTSEKDKISASYKIYKMGTKEEIPYSSLPEGTTVSISISENGKTVAESSDKKMELPGYTLKNTDTRIKATVDIKDFNSVSSVAEFTPVPYGSTDNFRIEADYLSPARSVKLKEIENNHETGIVFTIYKDDKPLTDPDLIKATNPVIKTSPAGNDGEITFTDDGKIIFIPKSAPSSSNDMAEVKVICTTNGNKKAEKSYSVVLADYRVKAVKKDEPIVKTRFFGNDKGVSFIILKNDIQLNKNEIGKDIIATLGDNYSNLDAETEISDDGIITIVPRSQKDYKINIFNWWTNWIRYFLLEDGEMTVTVSHKWCEGSDTLEITGENALYLIFYVIVPLLTELVLLGLLITWIYLVLTKPRYLNGTKLYVGTITYDQMEGTHNLRDFRSVDLIRFNKPVKKNGRLKFKKDADVISARGIKIRADHDGRIICSMAFPWYQGYIIPYDFELAHLQTPEQLEEYFLNHHKLSIEEFMTNDPLSDDEDRTILPSGYAIPKYIAVPAAENGITMIDDKPVIKSGQVFIYKN